MTPDGQRRHVHLGCRNTSRNVRVTLVLFKMLLVTPVVMLSITAIPVES